MVNVVASAMHRFGTGGPGPSKPVADLLVPRHRTSIIAKTQCTDYKRYVFKTCDKPLGGRYLAAIKLEGSSRAIGSIFLSVPWESVMARSGEAKLLRSIS